MSAEQNKEMVKATWTAFGKGDLKTAFGNMADNVSWFVPGTISGVSGVKRGKDEILKFMGSAAQSFRKECIPRSLAPMPMVTR